MFDGTHINMLVFNLSFNKQTVINKLVVAYCLEEFNELSLDYQR